ncbi:amidase [Kutzneria albida]|uniref:amidase n=1 Tax=Kutzneria albida TaxID=43357 RepID=UPI00046D35ED|nr:amidase [Kutzneria albida]
MTSERVHAFTGDVLGDLDAVGVAELVRSGEVSAAEVAGAAVARAELVDPKLRAVAFPAYDRVSAAGGLLAGVPTFVKDNTDVRGLPSGHGSAALRPGPAKRDAGFARQYLSSGVTVLGKSRLPEFGFNASTEFAGAEPTRNPWHTAYSAGASSGGAAALVAAGVVPIAHANDGGGSIRIPAACCGLVGLKPTRGRLVANEQGRSLPIDLVSDGVVSRSVRDQAAFYAAAERYWRNPRLPELGLVEGPGRRRLRIGLVVDSPAGVRACPRTAEVVAETVSVLEGLGHRVEPVVVPIDGRFVADFTAYWGMLSFLVSVTGKVVLDRSFQASRMDGLSQGLRGLFRSRLLAAPGMLYRLSRVRRDYARMFERVDLVLSPVLAHVTPLLGHLSPTVPFEELLTRLQSYVAYTPLNNVSGGPAISVPMGATAEGLPVGVQFSAVHGAERTLLELAFELEAARPWRRIQD